MTACKPTTTILARRVDAPRLTGKQHVRVWLSEIVGVFGTGIDHQVHRRTAVTPLTDNAPATLAAIAHLAPGLPEDVDPDYPPPTDSERADDIEGHYKRFPKLSPNDEVVNCSGKYCGVLLLTSHGRRRLHPHSAAEGLPAVVYWRRVCRETGRVLPECRACFFRRKSKGEG